MEDIQEVLDSLDSERYEIVKAELEMLQDALRAVLGDKWKEDLQYLNEPIKSAIGRKYR